MKYVINVLISFLLLSLITFALARYGLGNPFAGLGSKGYLSKSQVKELERAFGIEGGLGGFLRFLLSFLRGGPPSLLYGKPSLILFLSYAYPSFIILTLSFLASVIVSILIALMTGFKGNKLISLMAFVPEYFYAALFFLSSWTLGWPSPLPTLDLSKALAYSLTVFFVECPKLLHGLAGSFEDSKKQLEESLMLLKALGLPKVKQNLAILKFLLPSFASLSLYSFAMLIERSVLIEPFIGFPGMGNLLYTSVVNADITLAATSFLAIGVMAIAVASFSSFVEKALDARLKP